MNHDISLLQIEQNILRSLTAFTRPPQLPQIAEKLGFTTNAGQLKLSYYVDHLEKDGFLRYNRAWLHSDIYDEESLGWNLTPKGQSFLAQNSLS